MTSTPTVWLDLDTIIDHLSPEDRDENKACLLSHGLDRVRPVRVDYASVIETIREPANDNVEQLLVCALSTAEDRQSIPETLQTAEGLSDVYVAADALVEWMDANDITVPKKWRQYRRHPDIEDSRTVTYSRLKKLSGRHTVNEVAEWLASNNIAYFTGARNQPFTTVEALNKGLGIDVGASNDSDISERPKRKIQL